MSELGGYVAGPELGRDGAGTIVMARDRPTGADVAIRFLSPGLCASSEFMWRFRAEMAQLEVIEAANVAQVYELIERDGQVAVVTQLVDGPSLRDVLRGGALPQEAALCRVEIPGTWTTSFWAGPGENLGVPTSEADGRA